MFQNVASTCTWQDLEVQNCFVDVFEYSALSIGNMGIRIYFCVFRFNVRLLRSAKLYTEEFERIIGIINHFKHFLAKFELN